MQYRNVFMEIGKTEEEIESRTEPSSEDLKGSEEEFS